ncbi:MAG TPA: DinB family protein [Chryseolinea sp.]|nr:DinB family protein [Chryseolinea sp.]
METSIFGKEFLAELEAEVQATRKCLERVSETLYDWKPHEKSMTMGYLVLLVAQIPKWITHIIEISEIDLATFSNFQPKTTKELVDHFDENIEGAKKALKKVSDQELSRNFSLKANGQLIFTSPKKENVGSTLNHWVHHRGQLTVYMRLNDIAVPSIYGPSADDRTF